MEMEQIMLTKKQLQLFHQQGFLLIPQVFSAQQIKSLRELVRPKFEPENRAPGDLEDVLTDAFSRFPELLTIPFNPQLVDVMQSILGNDYVIMRDSCVHLNRFGGWHKDTTSVEMSGGRWFYEPNHLRLTMAVYLQDNTPEDGGGLDVEPGTHRSTVDPFVGINDKPRWMHRFIRRTGQNTYFIDEGHKYVRNVHSIASKAGDLVVFNCRINHRASQAAQPTGKQEKLAIFCGFSRNNEHVKNAHDFFINRPDPRGVYNYLRRDNPYPQNFVNQAKALGVNLA